MHCWLDLTLELQLLVQVVVNNYNVVFFCGHTQCDHVRRDCVERDLQYMFFTRTR